MRQVWPKKYYKEIFFRKNMSGSNYLGGKEHLEIALKPRLDQYFLFVLAIHLYTVH